MAKQNEGVYERILECTKKEFLGREIYMEVDGSNRLTDGTRGRNDKGVLPYYGHVLF